MGSLSDSSANTSPATEAARRCFQCGGPYHPATGHWDERWDVVFCGACYKPFVKWLAGHLSRRWRKLRFYDHAVSRTPR